MEKYPSRQCWDEDDYEPYELEERIPPQQLRQRQFESIRYEEDLEEENWSEATAKEVYEPKKYIEPESNDSYYDDQLKADPWDDEPKPINIPKKNKNPRIRGRRRRISISYLENKKFLFLSQHCPNCFS